MVDNDDEDWLWLPSDGPLPSRVKAARDKIERERAAPLKLSPVSRTMADLSRGVERPDIAELRRIAAQPVKNPRPTSKPVFVGKPEHRVVPPAVRATPTPERIIREAGNYTSRDSAAEGLGSGPVSPRGGFRVA